MSPDDESFLTADESRLDLWNVDKTVGQVYNLIDYERRNPSFGDERILSAKFNPESGCTFLYTTSKGRINICDLRERSNFHKKASTQLQVNSSSVGGNSVFCHWVDSVSDAKFVPNSNCIVSRDYMTVKLWDLRYGGNSSKSKPIYSAQVTDYMERNLPALHEMENLEDMFFLDVSPDGKHIATGGYNRSGHVMDLNATTNTTLSCTFRADRDAVAGKLKVYGKNKKFTSP